jgi:hypothetical protein
VKVSVDNGNIIDDYDTYGHKVKGHHLVQSTFDFFPVFLRLVVKVKSQQCSLRSFLNRFGCDSFVFSYPFRRFVIVKCKLQQNRLLNLRMLEEIGSDTFASKSRELRDREAELKLEIDVTDRGRHEIIDVAVKAFELSQTLRSKWLTADFTAKRRILEIICLNCTLDDVSLCVTMRKPFDLLAKGLVLKDSRGEKI